MIIIITIISGRIIKFIGHITNLFSIFAFCFVLLYRRSCPKSTAVLHHRRYFPFLSPSLLALSLSTLLSLAASSTFVSFIYFVCILKFHLIFFCDCVPVPVV